MMIYFVLHRKHSILPPERLIRKCFVGEYINRQCVSNRLSSRLFYGHNLAVQLES